MKRKLIQVDIKIADFKSVAQFQRISGGLDRAFKASLKSLADGEVSSARQQLDNVISARETFTQRFGNYLFKNNRDGYQAEIYAYNHDLLELSKLYAFRILMNLLPGKAQAANMLKNVIDTFFSYKTGINLPEKLELSGEDKSQLKSDVAKLDALRKAAYSQPETWLTLGGPSEHQENFPRKWQNGPIGIFIPDYNQVSGIDSFRALWADRENLLEPLTKLLPMVSLPGHQGRILSAMQESFQHRAQINRTEWADALVREAQSPATPGRTADTITPDIVAGWRDDVKASKIVQIMTDITHDPSGAKSRASAHRPLLAGLAQDGNESMARYSHFLSQLLDGLEAGQSFRQDPTTVKAALLAYFQNGTVLAGTGLFGLNNPETLSSRDQAILLRINLHLAGLNEFVVATEPISTNWASLGNILNFIQDSIAYTGQLDIRDAGGQLSNVGRNIQELYNHKLSQFNTHFRPALLEQIASADTSRAMLEKFFTHGYDSHFTQEDVLDQLDFYVSQILQAFNSLSPSLIIHPLTLMADVDFLQNLLIIAQAKDSPLTVYPEIQQKAMDIYLRLQPLLASPAFQTLSPQVKANP